LTTRCGGPVREPGRRSWSRGEAGIGKTRLVSELARRARAVGFETLVGRSLDLVGTELPYQPFIDALHAPGGKLPFVEGRSASSQLRVFEDLHWADPGQNLTERADYAAATRAEDVIWRLRERVGHVVREVAAARELVAGKHEAAPLERDVPHRRQPRLAAIRGRCTVNLDPPGVHRHP
jgi:hypothetical protein